MAAEFLSKGTIFFTAVRTAGSSAFRRLVSRVRVTSNESSPINLEARFAATVPIQAGSHHQRAFGSGVVVQHGSHEDPGVPSSRGFARNPQTAINDLFGLTKSFGISRECAQF